MLWRMGKIWEGKWIMENEKSSCTCTACQACELKSYNLTWMFMKFIYNSQKKWTRRFFKVKLMLTLCGYKGSIYGQ